MKRKLALTAALCLTASALFGCGGTQTPAETTAPQEEGTEGGTEQETAAGESQEASAAEAAEGEIPKDITATLRLSGPGLFTTVTRTGSTDMVTGAQKPGYQEVIDRWNEIYPNVTIEVEEAPWDNWTASLQTAALSGQVDILLHGASVTDVSEPLDPYIEKTPGLLEQVSATAIRKNESVAPYSENITYGMTITANPVMVLLDTKIFEDYGVAIPDASWSLEDLLAAAQQTTGTDPVTGQQTYGISMIKSSNVEKNYIWASRAMNNEVFTYNATVKESVVNFNTDKSKEVFHYLNELYKCSSPDYLEGLDIGKLYTEENDLAMYITEDPFGDFNKISVAGLEDRWMLVPLPAIRGGQYDGISASHLGDWNMAICNTSQQKDLAWEFIKFMVTDEFVQDWIIRTSAIPANKAAASLLSDMMPAQYAEPIQQVMENAPSDFCLQANASYNSISFGTFSTDINASLNEMFAGNIDAEEGVARVQSIADEFIELQ